MKILLSLLSLCLLFTLTVAAQDIGPSSTVYVTKSGTKYHVDGCSALKNGGIPMTLEKASEKYGPCSRCNPPVMTQKVGQASKKSVTSDKASSSSKSKEAVIGTTPSGKTIYEGPRGGKYHYSKSGKKVYEKKRR